MSKKRKIVAAAAPDKHSVILDNYDASSGLYHDFALRVRDLIDQMLSVQKISVHSVTYRLKGRDSLSGKLIRPGRDYDSLAEITDIAGVRIICFFAEDIDRIAGIINKEFMVDAENSIDKRRVLEPDQFGYLSLHHVVTLTDQRSNLSEYRRFDKLKVEIQTRSILQHAWAEIEHDLGYKSSLEVPKHLRRRVLRLSGLLELADQEFATVRDQITEYTATLDKAVVATPSKIELNKPALASFAIHNKVVRKIDTQVAKLTNRRLSWDGDVDYALTRLAWLGLPNLGAVEQALTTNAELIAKFALSYLRRPKKRGDINRGISLFYLAYVLVAQRNTSEIRAFVIEAVGTKNKFASHFTQRIQTTWREIQSGNRGAKRR